MTTEQQNIPVAPYMAVGLSTTITGIGNRKHIRHNLEDKV